MTNQKDYLDKTNINNTQLQSSEDDKPYLNLSQLWIAKS